MCLKLLKNQDRINPQIYIIWTDNQKYRVFTNFHRSFADRIFRYENIKYKFGEIAQEVIDNHLNACDSSVQDIKESPWVALHLRCPTKGLCAI